jgi:hypothetical protein
VLLLLLLLLLLLPALLPCEKGLFQGGGEQRGQIVGAERAGAGPLLVRVVGKQERHGP